MTLKIDKVRKSFGDKIAVDNLNMVVKPGEVVTCVAHVLKPRVKDHLLEVRNKTGRHEA